MADLDILTLNAAGDGWIDNTPAGVSTGYQAQNTNFTGRYLGTELDTVELQTAAGLVVLKGNSGAIDVNGVPFVITSDITFNFSSLSAGANYFEITPGASAVEKSVTLTTIAPTWDETLNYYKSSTGNRVLGWVVIVDEEDSPDTAGSGNDYVTVRRLDNHRMMNIEDELSGIGKGGKRYFNYEGSGIQTVHKCTIAETGVYSITVIAGGETFNAADPLTPGGNGGGACRADLRLLKGQTLSITVGSLNSPSTAGITGRISMVAYASGAVSLVSITGKHFGVAKYLGGITKFYVPVSTSVLLGAGGGAGPFGNGQSGIIEQGGTSGVDGASQIGDYGKGASGVGFVMVEWMSE